MSKGKRIAVTGMSINTPLGDTLPGFLDGLLAGRSALSNWKTIDVSRCYSKVGADLSEYDVAKKVASFEGKIPADVWKRLRKLVSKAPWSTKLSMLLAVDGWLDAGLFQVEGIDTTRVASIVAGHNINFNYQYQNRLQYAEEPDYMDSLLALTGLDTDHAGSVSEVLNVRGPIYTVGSACASANTALRLAIDELRYHGNDYAMVVGAVLDFSPVELHAMALMGAITFQSFNDTPQKASRPFDTKREGFVPAHGGGVMVLEDLEQAKKRGAKIYAEILAVETNSDANHLPSPSEEGQSRLMARLLKECELAPEQIDYINAHATSTPLGDLTETRSIKRVFGKHAYKLKVNATKSMLGHTCWAAPAVESIAAILQMNGGMLHPSINIENIDPEIDLDVCNGKSVEHAVRYCMKNSFGFGGINAVSIMRTPSAEEANLGALGVELRRLGRKS
ncbi:MAG: beta-ketoacyl-[acyl-carrier-protein] synthase family protein [Polyangiaceae bacterium]|nr:beta-ketoacyl-[acyl-carrier-protein] synthase family protein [Polyangiaceae bacterium]